MDHNTYRRMAEIQDRHWWYEGRRAILRSVIGRLGLPRSARILEAGSGTGANLRMLSEFGDVKGFEPDDFARDTARAVAGVDTPRGFLPDDVPYAGPFDLVCAFDVIEHVEKDAESLKALCALTAPGGYAVFTVPAFMFLWSRHDEVNHHFRRYRRPQFRALLAGAGYEVRFISYYNFALFPVVAGVRLARRFLKIGGGEADDAMPRHGLVNNALRAVFAVDRHLLALGPLPFGVSIIAVCRRPPV
jgi:SAM-dependent methyltransferase